MDETKTGGTFKSSKTTIYWESITNKKEQKKENTWEKMPQLPINLSFNCKRERGVRRFLQFWVGKWMDLFLFYKVDSEGG